MIRKIASVFSLFAILLVSGCSTFNSTANNYELACDRVVVRKAIAPPLIDAHIFDHLTCQCIMSGMDGKCLIPDPALICRHVKENVTQPSSYNVSVSDEIRIARCPPAAVVPSPIDTNPTRASLSGDGPYDHADFIMTIPANTTFRNPKIFYPTNGMPPYDLVALMPGYRELQDSVVWWGPRLASHGFVVILIDPARETDCPSLRADDLMVALNMLSAENERMDSPLYHKLAITRKAVMGHSMGGGGALIAAEHYPDLKAAIPLTPWAGGGGHAMFPYNLVSCQPAVSAGPWTYTDIIVPTLVVAGKNDMYAPADFYAHAFYNSIPSSTHKLYMEFNFGGHDAASFSHNAVLNTYYAVAWLKFYMDGDERYRSFLYGVEHSNINSIYQTDLSRFEWSPP